MTLDNFGLGCWSYGLAAPKSRDEQSALEAIRAAYDRGVLHFDTAQGYGDGRSEEILGSALADLPNAEIATKSSLLSRDETAEAVDLSRRRLRRDVIDLCYIHWPRKGMDARPMIEGLESARANGRIRRIGVSNFSVEDMERVNGVARIDVHQIGYSLLWRYPERDVIPFCRESHVDVYSYSSLAQGLLTGKMPRRPTFSPEDPRPATVFYDDEVWPHVYDAVGTMNQIARDGGHRLHHVALAWLVELAGVRRVLVGARTVTQLEDNLAAFTATPETGLIERLQEISDQAQLHIPNIGNIFKYYP